uniref:Putative secreted protein n=1 Tax=Ixodes ricinus TaxID=34613 RepID=A0A6B0UBC6_IXORI
MAAHVARQNHLTREGWLVAFLFFFFSLRSQTLFHARGNSQVSLLRVAFQGDRPSEQAFGYGSFSWLCALVFEEESKRTPKNRRLSLDAMR